MKSDYLLIIFLFLSTFGFAKVLILENCKEKDSGLPIPGVNVQIKTIKESQLIGKFFKIPSGSVVILLYRINQLNIK
jgi:hypothetical protein